MDCCSNSIRRKAKWMRREWSGSWQMSWLWNWSASWWMVVDSIGLCFMSVQWMSAFWLQVGNFRPLVYVWLMAYLIIIRCLFVWWRMTINDGWCNILTVHSGSLSSKIWERIQNSLCDDYISQDMPFFRKSIEMWDCHGNLLIASVSCGFIIFPHAHTRAENGHK